MKNLLCNAGEHIRYDSTTSMYIKGKQCIFLSYDISLDYGKKQGFEWDFDL